MIEDLDGLDCGMVLGVWVELGTCDVNLRNTMTDRVTKYVIELLGSADILSVEYNRRGPGTGVVLHQQRALKS